MRLAMKDELEATCRALQKIASHNYSVHEELLRTIFRPVTHQIQEVVEEGDAATIAQ